MPVRAITPDYRGDIRDRRENFGGNIIVYVGWDEHLLFCAAKTFPLPPEFTSSTQPEIFRHRLQTVLRCIFSSFT